MHSLNEMASGLLLRLNGIWSRYRAIVAAVLRWAIPALLLALIGYRLSQIGWVQIWRDKPTSPLFYLLLLVAFCIVPTADFAIYRYLWGVGHPVRLSVLLRKRFLNSTMVSYSGEAYFLLWARENLELPKLALLHAVKDNNLLSAGAAYVLMMAVLVLSLLAGAIPAIPGLKLPGLLLAGLVPLVLCGILVVAARRLTILSRRQMAAIFSIHFVRGALQLVCDFAILFFSGSMPTALMAARFVVLRMIVGHIPSPGNDLLVAGVGIEAARMMQLSLPRLAATLIIMPMATQVLNFAIVGLPWLVGQRRENSDGHESGLRDLAHNAPQPSVNNVFDEAQ